MRSKFTCVGTDGKARYMHQALVVDLRQFGELRVERQDAGEVDVLMPKIGEDLAEPRGVVLIVKAGRAEVAQHRVVAGLVGLL